MAQPKIDYFEKMLESALPVRKVRFHQPVINGYGEPESHFTIDNSKVQRKAEMFLTPNLLIILQNGKRFVVPFANIIEMYLA
jgi:hypothetical protein